MEKRRPLIQENLGIVRTAIIGRTCFFLSLLILLNCTNKTKKITCFTNANELDLSYALTELDNLLQAQGINLQKSNNQADADFLILLEDENTDQEGFKIEVTEKRKKITAHSRRGLLYGILEVAE